MQSRLPNIEKPTQTGRSLILTFSVDLKYWRILAWKNITQHFASVDIWLARVFNTCCWLGQYLLTWTVHTHIGISVMLFLSSMTIACPAAPAHCTLFSHTLLHFSIRKSTQHWWVTNTWPFWISKIRSFTRVPGYDTIAFGYFRFVHG